MNRLADALPLASDADLERRFDGLRRLYGDAGYRRIRAARSQHSQPTRWRTAPRRKHEQRSEDRTA
jgi:hypothetical protein